MSNNNLEMPQLRDTTDNGGNIGRWAASVHAAMQETAERRVPRIREVQEWARDGKYVFDLFISMDERNGPLLREAREALGGDVCFLRFAGAPICVGDIVSHMKARKETAEDQGKIYVPIFVANDECDASGGNGREIVNYLFELRGRLHEQLPGTQIVLATYLFRSNGSVIVFKPKAGPKDMRLDTRKLRHAFLEEALDFDTREVEATIDGMLANLYEDSAVPPIGKLLAASVMIPYPAPGAKMTDRFSHWVGVGDGSLELLAPDDSGLIITAPHDLFHDDTSLSFATALESLNDRLPHGDPIPVILSHSYGDDGGLKSQDAAMARIEKMRDGLSGESAGIVPMERPLHWFAVPYGVLNGQVDMIPL